MYNVEQEFEIGKMKLKNRLVLPPMASGHCNEDGYVTEELLDYYKEKAHGGYMGLIIVEHSFVLQQGKASPKQLSVASDECISGLQKLAETIHECGAKAVVQISHAGAGTKTEFTGLETVGPVCECTEKLHADRAMTREDIEKVCAAFAAAARRVKAAGFDGVEIHAAHGYLLNQFYSPLSNHRTDEYGGSEEKRMRFILEVIAAVREAVGMEYPVFLRLGACDYIESGNTIAHAVKACRAFAQAGVDLIDVSGGMQGFMYPGCKEKRCYFEDASGEIKANLHIPVIVTGGITDIKRANELLEEGKADLIGIGRAMYKDSHWAENAIKMLRERI